MTYSWIDRSPLRPDRYLDWQLVNRPHSREAVDGWCPVLVQLWAASGANPAAHLERLRTELETPAATTTTRTIAATFDELDLLSRRIDNIACDPPVGADDARFMFFVYMPESRAYTATGRFNHQPGYYDIRLVGPAIRGLVPDVVCKAPEQVVARRDAVDPTAVAIGIIDHAIAFANERFRKHYRRAGDVTRVERLWLQTTETFDVDATGTVLFGCKLEDEDIDGYLRHSEAMTGTIDERAVYAASGAVDFRRQYRNAVAQRFGHGTHVMDLAAGFDAALEVSNRPILAVQLPEPATLDTSGVTMASYALQGLRQIMLWADTIQQGRRLPLVINFSYGIHAGPKDGQHVLEREMERLVKSRNDGPANASATTEKPVPTVLVLPAGNAYRARVTARMSLRPGENRSIDWILQPDGGTASFLEIWFDGAASASTLAVEITPPGSAPIPLAMPAAGTAKILRHSGRDIGAVYFDAAGDIEAGTIARSRVLIAINPTKSYTADLPVAPSGAWRIALSNRETVPVEAELYIQRQDTPASDQPPGRQSFFDHEDAYELDRETGNYERLSDTCPITYDRSLSAFATGVSVVVGAAFEKEPGSASHEPSLYTSSGPTSSRPAPDFGAVADDSRALLGVFAAGTQSGSMIAMNGTSIAAPQVTRALADAGADVPTLMTALGVTSTAPADRRLGRAVVPRVSRGDIYQRKRP